jgi:hypothetical protein
MGQAAAFFGVDRRTYFKWEHGHISTASNAKKIQPEKLEQWKKPSAVEEDSIHQQVGPASPCS